MSWRSARVLACSLVEARRLGGTGSASPRGPKSSRLVGSSTDWDGCRIAYWMRFRGGSHGIVGEGVFRTKGDAGPTSGTHARTARQKELADFPGVAGAEEFVQVARAALGDYVFDLLVQNFFVTRLVVPVAQDADGGGEAFALFHLCQGESVG